MCNSCQGIDHLYDLSKTDWVEIDIPVLVEATLMKIFSQLRTFLPGNRFYMAFKDTNFCFGADNLQTTLNLNNLIASLDTNFKLKPETQFPFKQDPPIIESLVLIYQKSLNDELLIDRNFIMTLKAPSSLPIMHDQF